MLQTNLKIILDQYREYRNRKSTQRLIETILIIAGLLGIILAISLLPDLIPADIKFWFEEHFILGQLVILLLFAIYAIICYGLILIYLFFRAFIMIIANKNQISKTPTSNYSANLGNGIRNQAVVPKRGFEPRRGCPH